MADFIGWVLATIGNALYGLGWTILNIGTILDLGNPESVFRIVFYGASGEFLALVLLVASGIFVAGLFRPDFLWGVVRTIEGFSNGLGRFAAWAGLIMVLQQILIVFLQSVFRVAEISIGPFGMDFQQPLGWYGDGLKLYNAIIVCLCCAYTFVQGGHVRVDLFYAGWNHRRKKIADMFGTLFFMLPALFLMWFYGWFYMWRHLIKPNVSATDTLDRMLLKARAFNWSVETFAASPSGFNAYFLYKVLLLLFCFTMILQAFAFFYRSWLELKDGKSGRYLDQDVLDPVDELASHGAAKEGGH